MAVDEKIVDCSAKFVIYGLFFHMPPLYKFACFGKTRNDDQNNKMCRESGR